MAMGEYDTRAFQTVKVGEYAVRKDEGRAGASHQEIELASWLWLDEPKSSTPLLFSAPGLLITNNSSMPDRSRSLINTRLD